VLLCASGWDCVDGATVEKGGKRKGVEGQEFIQHKHHVPVLLAQDIVYHQMNGHSRTGLVLSVLMSTARQVDHLHRRGKTPAKLT
jgi:hypothetical protein